MKFFTGIHKLEKSQKLSQKKSNFDFFEFMKCFYLEMAYSKCFNANTLIACYENLTKKQNSDCLDRMTCDNWVPKMFGQKFGFYSDFLISNIFVELLVIHIKLYIFWKYSLSSAQKCEIKSQNLMSFQDGKIFKIANFSKV